MRKMRFIGTDNSSMETGRVYPVKLYIRTPHLSLVVWVISGDRAIPYSSIEKMLDNWRDVRGEGQVDTTIRALIRTRTKRTFIWWLLKLWHCEGCGTRSRTSANDLRHKLNCRADRAYHGQG